MDYVPGNDLFELRLFELQHRTVEDYPADPCVVGIQHQ